MDEILREEIKQLRTLQSEEEPLGLWKPIRKAVLEADRL